MNYKQFGSKNPGIIRVHYYAAYNYNNFVKNIISAKTKDLLVARDTNLETPLHKAAKALNKDVIAYYLRHRPIVFTYENLNKETPFHFLCAKNIDQNILNEILELFKFLLFLPNGIDITPIYYAYQFLQDDNLKFLIEINLEVVNNTLYGLRLSHLACYHFRNSIVELVINKNEGEIYESSENGMKLVHVAAKYENIKILEMMLNIDSNIAKLKDGKDGYNALHYAVIYRQYAIARMLLERDNSLNNFIDVHNNLPEEYIGTDKKLFRIFSSAKLQYINQIENDVHYRSNDKINVPSEPDDLSPQTVLGKRKKEDDELEKPTSKVNEVEKMLSLSSGFIKKI